ncbi:MAG TPA: NAD(P)-dependent oxidoreductase [Smithellaceae bacterium]|nr:NAD(P)-dependent oxidoreductase [Smithellaceae bacterium]
MTDRKKIIITGGSGFVGGVLRQGLRDRGYDIEIFDPMKGFWVELLRRRYLGASNASLLRLVSPVIRRTLAGMEWVLVKSRMMVPEADDILDIRDHLIDRFRNSYAVIHLAALPHPFVPGMTPADYQRINYDGSINVFEAARAAGVRKFIFASSAQIYNINKPAHIEQFPILETNYLPTVAEGQSWYGFLKGEVERYMAKNCTGHDMQSIAFRLEFPGVRSLYPWNFYISTSVENTVSGFIQALEKDIPSGFEAFNLADRYIDPGIVDIQNFLKNSWPHIPNHTTGNECPLSTEKARSVLGYSPQKGGTYYSFNVMW